LSNETRKIKAVPSSGPDPTLIRRSTDAKQVSMSVASVIAALGADAPSLSALLQQIPAGVCVYDSESRPLLNNEAFTRIVGSVEASVQAASPLAPLLARARAGEAVVNVEVEWPAEVSPHRAHATAVPARQAGGKVGGVVLMLVDASVESGQRETMGIVGHDLRNPLAAIRMTAQLLSKPDEMAPERRMTLAKRILTSSIRMDSIVKSLLDYARAKAGALVRLEREPVDLGALAARVIEEHSANVTGRTVELRTVGDLTGQWDPGRLEQIVGHLVANALRHGADGASTLTIDGSSPDRVILQSHNNGPAIPSELLPRIFEPFQIGPRPEGTPRRSIGLGLFVVKELANAHGGGVAAQSSEGSGTEFTVTLPRKAADVVTTA
jgi:signal transduction histidine kinase